MKIELTDLQLSASLVSLGFTPSIRRAENQQIIFEFNRTPEIEATIEKFWTNKLQVNPKTYWNSVRELKSRINSFIRPI